MEPPGSPYNLRSRARVISLRSRQVLVDTTSRKPYLGGSRRLKPRINPSAQKHPQEQGESRKRYRILPLLPKDRLPRPPEEAEWLFLCYLRRLYPYPLLAMEYYNKRHEGEEQYKVSKQLPAKDKAISFAYLGSLRILHFEAKPISLEKPDSLATKRFFARVHVMPGGNRHVSECYIYPGPPESGTSFEETNPVGCKVCGLEDEYAFMSKSMELRRCDFIPPSCCGRRGPVAKSAARARRRGSQKFQAEASSKGGKS